MALRCLKLVATNFLHMYDADFYWIDPSTFLMLVKDKRLAVHDEWPLFQVFLAHCIHIFRQSPDIVTLIQHYLLNLSHN